MFDSENPLQIDLVTIGRSMGRERRQDGWVEKRGGRSKSWAGFWYEYRPDDDGKEKRFRKMRVLGKCSEMTKGAAEETVRELIRNDKVPTSQAKFSELTTWYLHTHETLWSEHWMKTVQGFFKHHILPELGDRKAADLRKSEIQVAINNIAAKPNARSGSLVNKCLTLTRSVFQQAVDDEILQRNPVTKITMPPTRKASERFLTLEECRRLLSVANQRDAIVLRLFMVIGLRPGELFALRVNDLLPGSIRIDQVVRQYRVQDGAKTEESIATLPLPYALETELRRYIMDAGITDLLFPSETGLTPLSPDNFLDRVLKRLGVVAGIDVCKNAKGETTSKLNHQVLRRTTATHFQKHGQIKDTQGLLRHTDASTTLKHYQKRLDESLVSGVDSWDAELIPRKGAVIEFPDPRLRKAN